MSVKEQAMDLLREQLLADLILRERYDEAARARLIGEKRFENTATGTFRGVKAWIAKLMVSDALVRRAATVS